jgi:uncharacterized membrane protein
VRTRAQRRAAARYRWDRLKVSFWFAPVAMATGAVLLAWELYALDGRIPNEALDSSRFILSGSAADMRAGLLAIAATVLTTAGVVFTLLTLPLSTVAAQYGSRLLRLYLGDRTTQVVLGMFVATIVYCLAAAMCIPGSEVGSDPPQLTVTVALYLMLATLASLIALIQHIGTMLQAPNIAAAAGAELMDVVRAEVGEVPADAVASDDVAGAAAGARPADDLPASDGYPVRAVATGYIQLVDPEALLKLAREKDLIVHLLHQPGRYVGERSVLALVWPADRVGRDVEEGIRGAFQVGNGRTPTQDLTYAVSQLTEMAVRAMSPAINDPFTAMTCLDHIGDGLVAFVRHGVNGRFHHDDTGRLRLVREPVGFDALLAAAFDMLRHASCDNASVLGHMLAVIDRVGREARSPEARRMLSGHVALIEAECRAGSLVEADRHALEQRCQDLMSSLALAPS